MKQLLTLPLFVLAGLLIQSSASAGSNKNGKLSREPVVRSLDETSFGFIENKGQFRYVDGRINSEALYVFRSDDHKILLHKNGFSHEHFRMVNKGKAGCLKVHRVDVRFRGSNAQAAVTACDPAPDYINYYLGDRASEQLEHVRHYGKVLYRELYPGIDLEFVYDIKGNKPSVKYNIIVRPGGRLEDVVMDYSGASGLKLREGKVQVATVLGALTEDIPYSYTTAGAGEEKAIQVQYLKQGSSIRFSVPAYDRSRTLVVDPVPNLLWGTYYGGSGQDTGYDLAIDGSGNIIVAGYTRSTTDITPNGPGSYQKDHADPSWNDAFIVKLNGSGVRQWATYYGGTASDVANAVTVDNSGNIIVVGETESPTAMASAGAHQTSYSGGSVWETDAFVVKFSPAGSRLWGTYYGSTGDDWGNDVVTDGSGNIYLGGTTTSATDIATSGTYKSTAAGNYDAMLVMFNSSGVRQWGTYYGGPSVDDVNCMAIDGSGGLYIAGATASTSDIAGGGGVYQNSFAGGSRDGFVAKFNSTGTSRVWGTYYGGSAGAAVDLVYDVAVDGSGNVYIVGETSSTDNIASANAHQTVKAGIAGYDGFIAKLTSAGGRAWGTYYGGTGSDKALGVAVDGSGNILVCGYSSSSAAIGTAGTWQSSLAGGNDVFVVKFDGAGTRVWGTYYGGGGSDASCRIAVIGSTDFVITGDTNSGAGIATPGAHQTSFNGTYDAIIARFSATVLPVELVSFTAEKRGGNCYLRWSAAAAPGSSHFVVERLSADQAGSLNGTDFTAIGTVMSTGNSGVVNQYEFTVSCPPAPNSCVFFRLRLTDADGSFSFSPVIPVCIQDDASFGITALESDRSSHDVTVTFTVSQNNTPVRVELYNLAGQRVASATLANLNSGPQHEVVLRAAHPGIYSVVVCAGDDEVVRKVVVP